MATNLDYEILIIGDQNVGKTSLIKKFTIKNYNFIENSYSYTSCIKRYSKTIILPYDKKIKLNIIDTDGNIKTNSASFKNACKKAHGIIILYDINKINSLENVLSWLKQIKDNDIIDDTIIFLVGNKNDTLNESINESINRHINLIEGIEFAQNQIVFETNIKNKMVYFKISVKDNKVILFDKNNKDNKVISYPTQNIDYLFTNIASKIITIKQKPRQIPSFCLIL